MSRIVSGISTLRQHNETLRSKPEVYRPLRCPNCKHSGLWNHGFYFRKAERHPTSAEACLNPISIPRYLCSSCLHSCSRLPECIPPRRWYSWLFQQQVLKSLLTGGSLHRSSVTHDLCRNTVRRWWRWLALSTPTFEFFLKSRYPELGRSADWQSFWLTCLSAMSLSCAMADLDHDGVDVP
jgi:hypothetical protein